MQERYKSMVCLVGQNPLPVYLGIRQLTTPDAKIWLVHSPGASGTQPAANRIQDRLRADPDNARTCSMIPLQDPFSPTAVQAVMARLRPQNGEPVALNYTGGTKVMSAFSVLAWGECLPHVWYLDEGRGRFHSGTGVTEGLQEIGLTARDLCALHGIRIQQDTGWQPDPTADDLRAIYSAWKGLEPKKRPSFGWGEDFQGGSKERDFQWYSECQDAFAECLRWLTASKRKEWMAFQAPSDAASYAGSKCQRAFEFFAKHQWLEYVVREAALCLPADNARYVFGKRPKNPLLTEDAVLFSQEFIVGRPTYGSYHDPKMFEGDMLVVMANRLRYLSVTTSFAPAACKEKMFEAMHRSRQVGGDLATSCVVSTAWKQTVKACQDSINEHPRHTIYGEADLDSWFTDPASLREFLTRDF